MILTAALLMLVGPAFVFDETEPPADVKPRELKLDKVTASSPGPKGRFGDPTKITSKKELKEAIARPETVEAISKQVDFSKEIVLLFSWDGSGRDTLTFERNKKEVAFTRTLGRTRDLRFHVKVFAVPKGTKVTTVSK